jgi:NDP-sugar pyrophosphorylase family protein
MKAMVLAAGLGLRMRPLSRLRAKPALPVLNRPLLHWTLDLLARHGVTDVVVNTHHRAASVRRSVGDGSAFGVRVSFSHEPRILGTGGGPRRVRALLGDGPFILANGDILFDFDLSALVATHRASGALATLALRPNPDPKRYGPVVTSPRGRIRSILGRPSAATGRISLFAGVHVLDASLLERLPRGASDSVRDLYLPLLAEGASLLGVRTKGAWYDLGTPALYLAAQTSLLAAGRGDATGSSVDASAHVAAGARIVRSVVGPGCRVEAGASVIGSVLWERVAVGERAQVRGSILADGVRVASGGQVTGRIGTRSSRGQAWSKLRS